MKSNKSSTEIRHAVDDGSYQAEARRYAQVFIETGSLPNVTPWKIENAFNFAPGLVDADIRASFGLGESTSWSDVLTAIQKRLKGVAPTTQADQFAIREIDDAPAFKIRDGVRKTARPPAGYGAPKPAETSISEPRTVDELSPDWRDAVAGN